MPFQSQAQRGLFYATAAGADTGVPLKVAREFIAHDRPGKLPEHVRAEGGGVDDQHIATALHALKRAYGGVAPEIPYFERQEARNISSPYGLGMGYGSGRFDKNNVSVGASSYVLPSDVVAGLGDGNNLAGARAWDAFMSSMPYGIAPPRMGGGHRGPPHPPTDPELARGMFGSEHALSGSQIASGGKPKGAGEHVPVVIADGEIVIPPEDVARIGMEYWKPGKPHTLEQLLSHGHQVLDAFVKEVRGRVIKRLKALPGPKGSDQPKIGHHSARAKT